MHKQLGWPQAWEYCQAKSIQTLGRASQGVNWSWSQCIKSHHAQTSSGKELPSHFWTRNIIRSILPGLRRRRTGLVLSAPKSSFQMKVHLACHLEIRVPESGGRVERHRIHVAWSPVWSFHSQWWFGLPCHLLVLVLCFLKSTVNAVIYQEILEHFMLSSADKLYGDADFIFQQDLAPAHTAKGTKSWFNDHGVTVLDWPANSPDLNPRESRRETPDPTIQMTWTPENLDERHQTQQYRWPEDLHYTWAVPQTDRLHAVPHRCSHSCKRRPNQVLIAAMCIYRYNLFAHPCLFYYLLSPQYAVLHILFYCTFYSLFFLFFCIFYLYLYIYSLVLHTLHCPLIGHFTTDYILYNWVCDE